MPASRNLPTTQQLKAFSKTKLLKWIDTSGWDWDNFRRLNRSSNYQMHLGKSNGKNRTKIDKKILKATRNIDNEPFCYYDHFKRGFLMDVSQWSCVVKWLSHCQLTTTSTTTTHNAKGIWKRQEISIDNELVLLLWSFQEGIFDGCFSMKFGSKMALSLSTDYNYTQRKRQLSIGHN